MRFANAMDNATWTPPTKQAGQYTGPGRGLDVPSSDVMSLIQLDYILTSPKFSTEKSWCDFSIPIGLDHRCVHCQLRIPLPKPKKRKKKLSLKNWRPNLDENNVALDFQSKIRSLLAANCTANMEVLENMLVQAGIHHGTVLKFRRHFRPSTELKTLSHFGRILKHKSLAKP